MQVTASDARSQGKSEFFDGVPRFEEVVNERID